MQTQQITIPARIIENITIPPLLRDRALMSSDFVGSFYLIKVIFGLINKCASYRWHSDGLQVGPYLIHRVSADILSYIIDADEMIRNNWPDASATLQLFMVEAELAHYFLNVATGNDHVFNSRDCLAEIILRIEAINVLSEDGWWYYVRALNELAYFGFDDEDEYKQLVETMLRCAENISDNDRRQSVLYLIINRLKSVNFFPEFSIFDRMHRIGLLSDHEYMGMAANAQKDFVLENLIGNNKDYILFEYPNILQRSSRIKTIKCEVKKDELAGYGHNSDIVVSISENDLLHFAGHIIPRSTAIPSVLVPNLNEELQRMLDLEIIESLCAKNYCNSEGMLIDEFYRKDNAKDIADCAIQAMKRFYRNRGQTLLNQADLCKQLFTQFRSPEVRTRNAVIKDLRVKTNGLLTTEALMLVYKCLELNEYGLEQSRLEEVKQTLLLSLVIYTKVQSVFAGSYSNERKNMMLRKLCDNVVKAIDKGAKVILALGTPIRHDATKSSHAIYCGLKRKDRENGQPSVLAIIANGGRGVSKFHKVADTWDPNDIGSKRYKYAGIEPVDLDADYHAALVEYVYRLLSLEYTKALDDDEIETDERGQIIAIGENINTFTNLFGNIYLANRDEDGKFFYGINNAKVHFFRRNDDLGDTFREQISGTCTVFNLLRAIKLLFDMDEYVFGQLQLNIVMGLNLLLTNLKNENKIPDYSENDQSLSID